MRIGLQSKGGRKVVGGGKVQFASWLLSPGLTAATSEAAAQRRRHPS